MSFYQTLKEKHEQNLKRKLEERESFLSLLSEERRKLSETNSLLSSLKNVTENFSEIQVFKVQKELDDLTTAWQRFKLLHLKISHCNDEIEDLMSGIEELSNVFLKEE